METLDLTPLANATKRFEEALIEYTADPERTIVRDGLIQRFEFTYGLSEAMLRRFLEVTTSGRDDIDALSFPAIIRTASEKGLLLHGWDSWHGYRKARNQTSHTYNETIALEVVTQLPSFLAEVRHLLAKMTVELS